MIYQDSNSASDLLENALSLPDLTADQRKKIVDISIEYRSEYEQLSGDLVAMAIAATLSELNVQDAQASVPADKEMIDDAVQRLPGGFERPLHPPTKVTLHQNCLSKRKLTKTIMEALFGNKN